MHVRCVTCQPWLVRLEVVRRTLKINISEVPVRRRDSSMLLTTRVTPAAGHTAGAAVPSAWDQVDSYEHISAHLQAFCQ